MHKKRRLPSFPGLLLLAAMALGLVLQPVLASIGELHAQAHDPTGSHPLAAQLDHPPAADGHDDHDDHPAGDEDSDPLHALIHLAHCCGQSFATLPSPFLVTAHLLREPLPIDGPQILAQGLPLAPFRPPIAS